MTIIEIYILSVVSSLIFTTALTVVKDEIVTAHSVLLILFFSFFPGVNVLVSIIGILTIIPSLEHIVIWEKKKKK